MSVAVVFIVTTTAPFAPVHSSFSASTGGLVFVALAVLLLIPLSALWFLLVLYRLLRPAVSLSITPDGILDNCSLFATGLGLIRWDNLAAVNPIGHSRFAPDSAVRIAVRDASAVLAGRPWQVRLLRRIFVAVTRVETDLYIPLFMIDAYRAGDLVAVIRRQYEVRRAADRHLAALPPARIIA